MSQIDVVFDPTGHDPAEGSHSYQGHQTAPGAWDQNTQAVPQTIHPMLANKYNAITQTVERATATFARSVNHHTFSAVPIAGTTVDVQGPAELVSAQKGRAFVIVKCPTTNTKGVWISEQKDTLVAAIPLAWFVAPADPPLFIPTEDSIWFISQTGAAQTDMVQLIVGWYRPDEY